MSLMTPIVRSGTATWDRLSVYLVRHKGSESRLDELSETMTTVCEDDGAIQILRFPNLFVGHATAIEVDAEQCRSRST